MKAKPIELGGRKFRAVVESTVEHDIEVRALVHDAGFDLLAKRKDESPDDFVVRMIGQLSASRKDADFAGVLLVPEELDDTEWTPEVAVETTRFIKKLTAQADKLILRNLSMELLSGFINAGLLFSVSSPDYSSEGIAARPVTPERTASASGRNWFGGLRDMIRRVTGMFSESRSARRSFATRRN
jgi:hypothetical protein